MTPERCAACDRYCDGCSFSRSLEAKQEDDPLAVARGIVNGIGLGILLWALLILWFALIWFRVIV